MENVKLDKKIYLLDKKCIRISRNLVENIKTAYLEIKNL